MVNNAAAAFAQDAQPAPDSGFGANEGNEIIVTATKRAQTLQDAPVAVSVTTGETLERAQVRDIQDLQVLVPALRVVQLQGSAATNFFIRGFGNGSNNVGIEPSVGVFIDGVFRSRTASQLSDFPDIQRVEVLRGPQSTLFGKNASAGVISIVTREPTSATPEAVRPGVAKQATPASSGRKTIIESQGMSIVWIVISEAP